MYTLYTYIYIFACGVSFGDPCTLMALVRTCCFFSVPLLAVRIVFLFFIYLFFAYRVLGLLSENRRPRVSAS